MTDSARIYLPDPSTRSIGAMTVIAPCRDGASFLVCSRTGDWRGAFWTVRRDRPLSLVVVGEKDKPATWRWRESTDPQHPVREVRDDGKGTA